MNIDDIKRVLVLGAGTMGHQIGFLCAVHGYEVVIYDNCPDIFDKARHRLSELADEFIRMGHLSSDKKRGVLERISFSSNPDEAARDVDLVSESVPEDPTLKAKVFSTFNALCPERTIFTTNTSTLTPSMFAEATGRPDKFLAFHFHNILLTNVVDIMPHPDTAQKTIDLVDAFARRLGQVVILMKNENSGYVFNAMLVSLIDSALTLASKNVASPEDIDRAWMGVLNAPVGPFGIMDNIGLDLVWKVFDNQARASNKEPDRVNADFVKSLVACGKLGRKSGEGFYRYPDPLFTQKGFLDGPGREDGRG